jgi:proteasome lid subunit RPN8/RPN11
MLFLRSDQLEFMHKHVEACLPNEGCGLIGGKNGCAELLLTVTNSDHSPITFDMDAQELLSAHLAFEEAGLELAAIFHSHPDGPAVPSETDVRASIYHPGVISVILVKEGKEWRTRAYQIDGEGYKQVEIKEYQ